jgi:hypothetical protein
VLAPHVEVLVAPDEADLCAAWADTQPPFDLVIVSEGVGPVGADLVVELPCAAGGGHLGVAREAGAERSTVHTLADLLELLPRTA